MKTCFVVVFILIFSCIFADGTQPSGSGTTGDPYTVSTLNHLLWISTTSTSWDKVFLQTADIDASSTATWNSNTGWSPIGTDWDHAFYGTYDGGEHTISGLTLNRGGNYLAFIGVAREASIKNLTISAAYIKGTGDDQSRIGVLAGECQGSVVTNCHTSGTVEGDGGRVGGLIGQNGGFVTDCSFSGSVLDDMDGSHYFGGLVGYNSGTIEDSYTSAAIRGNWYAGGLVGYNTGGTINRCYSTTPDGSSVFGSYNTGGLVGENLVSASINESYSSAEVVGFIDYTGGLVGWNNSSTISNCYSRGSVSRSQGGGGSFGSFIGRNESALAVTNCYATGEVIYQNDDNPTDKGFIGNYNATGCSDNFFDLETTYQSSGTGATAKDTDAMKGITPGNTLTDWGWSTDTWERIGDNYPRLKDNPDPTLPVTLSTFTAQFLQNMPTLYWITQSETDNIGWFVYRNEEENFTNAEVISELIEGHGTTTQQQFYIYEDNIENLNVGDTYYYWLESVDFSGMVHHYNRVAQLTISDPLVNPPIVEPPTVYDFKNVPNPVNGSTKFQFTLDKTNLVSVSIYNIKGELVKTFPGILTQPDEEENIYWNGKDNSGKMLTPGIYFYNLIVNGKIVETKKLILMK